MKILVTGSSGQFGRRLVPVLKTSGYNVVCVDLAINIKQNAGSHVYMRSVLHDVDVVVHLAAIPWGKAHLAAQDYWQANILTTQVVTDAAIIQKVPRMILASSTGYYGFQTGFPMGAVWITPKSENLFQRYLKVDNMPDMDTLRRAQVYYMGSKVAAEAVLSMRALAGEIQGIILRFAPVTAEPYTWGIQCKPETATNAILECIEASFTHSLEVFNIGEQSEVLEVGS